MQSAVQWILTVFIAEYYGEPEYNVKSFHFHMYAIV